MKLNALIIEDELKSRDTLRNMLSRFCPNVQVVGEAVTVEQGIDVIEANTLDIVFLDIELPGQNGFALLEYYPDPDFSIIFTTAYDQYAVQAFRISAVDYLLKPINFNHLRQAVEKVEMKKDKELRREHLATLNANIQNSTFNKIALPSANGYLFTELENIIACEADRNYTLFYLNSEKKLIVSKPLKYFEELLCHLHFFRINRSFIINLHFLESYMRTQKGEVVLKNGMILPLSDQKKEQFLKRIDLMEK